MTALNVKSSRARLEVAQALAAFATLVLAQSASAQVGAPGAVLRNHPAAVTPVAIYSTRRVNPTYVGNAMLIRRASDSATTDIGFSAAGVAKTASISSFCGTDVCYVQTWYDQSGNGKDATQTTPANQPRIYNGTVVDLMNGAPAPTWNQASASGAQELVLPSGTWQTVCIVRDTVASPGGGGAGNMQYLFSAPANTDFSIRFNNSTPNYYGDNNGNDWTNAGTMYVGRLVTKVFASGIHQICAVGGSAITGTASIGSTANPRNLFGGDHVGEVVIYSTALSSTNVFKISNDQRNFWGTP